MRGQQPFFTHHVTTDVTGLHCKNFSTPFHVRSDIRHVRL